MVWVRQSYTQIARHEYLFFCIAVIQDAMQIQDPEHKWLLASQLKKGNWKG